MKRTAVWFFGAVLVVSASVVSGQSISLSGKVTNKSGKGIPGAIVVLARQKIADTTDAQGAFSINKQTFVIHPSPVPPSSENVSFTNGIVVLDLMQPARVGIETFDIKGNRLSKVVDQVVSAGDYRFDMMNHALAANIVFIRVSIGQRVSTFRHLPIDQGRRMIAASITPSSNGSGALEKIQDVVDSLKAAASGYVSNQVVISSYQGVVNIALDSITLPKFSFFVTSLKGLQALSNNQNGFGGDLRFGKTGQGAGLLGADSICQCLAERSMPGSKVKIWRAFLSVAKDVNGKQVNAIDRIGKGPWYDRLGRLMSNSITDLLHDRPNADAAIKNDLPNEDGVPNHQPDPNQPAVDNHQFITGSDSLGRLYSGNSTCQDWTSNTDTISKPRSGLSWPKAGMGGMSKEAGAMPGGNMKNWISVWDLWGCKAGLDLTDADMKGKPGVYTIGNGGGYGGFYCFSLNP